MLSTAPQPSPVHLLRSRLRRLAAVGVFLVALAAFAGGVPGFAQEPEPQPPTPAPRPIPPPRPVPGPTPTPGNTFTLTPSSDRRDPVIAGETITVPITVSCAAGRSMADLSVTVAPPGPTVSISPTRVTIPNSKTPANATITFATDVATPSGSYVVTILAQVVSGPCNSKSASLTLEVARPVKLEVSPVQQNAPPGGSAVYNVTIRRLSSFNGRITLRTSGLPASFPEPTFNPNDTNGNASTLTVAVPNPTNECPPPNGCRFKIRGETNSGVQIDAADAQLIVQRSVTFTANPMSSQAKTGDTVRVEIGIVRSGYMGEVSIGPSGPPLVAIDVDPPPPTLGSVYRLDIKLPPGVPGIYQFTATPVLPPGNQDVVMVPAKFEIRVSLAFEVTIRATPLAQTVVKGQPAFLDLEITKVNVAAVTFSGVLGLPSGTVAQPDRLVDPTRVTIFTSPLTDPGIYPLVVQVQFVDPDGLRPFAFSNPVSLNVLGDNDTPRVDLGAEDVVKDVVAGGSATFRITATRRNGFTGQVNPNSSPTPAPGGASASFSPASLPNGVNESTLTVSAPAGTPAGGPFTLNVGATTNPAVPVTATMVRYRIMAPTTSMVSLAADPASLTINSGQAATSTITATRTNCAAPITLTRPAILPPEIADLTFRNLTTDRFEAKVTAASVSAPRTVWLPIGAQAPGCANLQVQQAMLSVTVQPLGGSATLMLQPTVVNVAPGQSASTNVQIIRAGTIGAITLAANGLPPGISASFSPNPAPGATALLTLVAAPNAAAQSALFQVTGSAASGSVTPANGTVVVSGAPPTITSFTPASGTAGTNVQIFGTNLTNVQNVLFNGVGAAFAPITQTQVNATVPGFATTGPIAVVTAAGTAVSPTQFIVGPSSQTPQILGFTPASGPAGTPVRINGVNLGGVFDVSLGTPTLGFTPVPFTPLSTTQIDVLIPADGRSGFFRLTTPNGTATSATAFQVTTPNLPEIGGFNPISGPPGTRVEIVGSNLGGATQVTFNGATAFFEPPQPNRIFATVPALATTGQIRVTTPAGTAVSFTPFAVTSGGPVITGFQPQSGRVGDSVTIAGANLNGTTEVTFSGVRAQIGIVLGNFVQVFVPGGATTGLIRLVTPAGMATSPTPFTVLP